jgi:hypothetical protein
MKATYAISLAIAAVLSTHPPSMFSQSGDMQSSPPSQSTDSSSNQPSSNQSSSSNWKQEEMQMVPAQAALLAPLDSSKLQPGAEVRAQLTSAVHLPNGADLRSGTVLVGQVANDDSQMNGAAKLALRFTEADPKGGQPVPIKATIVGIDHPVDPTSANQPPNNWNDGTKGIDQMGAISGVDLHSKIASPNSGMLIATKKNDIKLEKGSILSMGIGALNQQTQNSGAPSITP